MDMILAVGITLLSVCIVVLIAHNDQLHKSVDGWKAAHTNALCETREWESKYWGVATGTENPVNPEAPPSHGAKDIDVAGLIESSEDPVWDTVIDCRSVGVMAEWLHKNPAIAAQMPHRQYGEFATYILQLPESEQTVAGVARAVRS